MGSLIKPLSAMTVATTLDGHAPTGGSGVRTQVANGATMSLKDWWNNTGKNLYTELVNNGNITTTAPVKQEYTPGVTLSGVMDRANLIMGRYNTTSPETQQAAVSAGNNSSFNFDAPTFDPNAGKQEARDKMYSDYMTTLANSGKRRINMQKANKNFNEQFEQDWLNGEADRRNQFNLLQRDKKMNALKQSFFDDANNFSINLQDDVNAAKEAQGLVMDPATGEWKSRTEGLDFNNTRAVLQWLTDNGFDTKGVDGLYGANTKKAIDTMLSSNNFALTPDEKEAFRNFQNNATFVRTKQPIVKQSVIEEPVVKQSLVKSTPVIKSNQPKIPTEWYTGTILDNTIGALDNSREAVERRKNADEIRKLLFTSNSYLRAPYNYSYASHYINGKEYPIVVTKNLGTSNRHNDLSFYYDPETKMYAVAEENWLGHPLGFATYGDNKMTWYTWNDIVNDRVAKGSYNKQGGILIKKHQQGGNMEQQEQKEFMAFLIQDAQQQGILLQSEKDVETYLLLLGEEGIQAKYLEFKQLKQGSTPVAKLGTKLNYIKQLKGDCPSGEELVYFKKGGMICSKCEKKHEKVVAAEGKKLNAIDEFKKNRKK